MRSSLRGPAVGIASMGDGMEPNELEQLDGLLHKLRQDAGIMEGLSVLEQQQIAGASDTICSLLRTTRAAVAVSVQGIVAGGSHER